MVPKRASSFYVYTYAYPASMGDAIFYVGKGSGKRINIHEKEARSSRPECNTRKHDVIREIWDAGEKVVKTIVFETQDEKEAIIYENRLIKENALTLVNVVANPNVKRYRPPVRPKMTREAFFKLTLERAKIMNRIAALNRPLEEREEFLAELDQKSIGIVQRRIDSWWKDS